MKLLRFSILLVFLCSTTFLNSQIAELKTQSINEGSIDDQFEFLLKKSGNFKGTDGQSYEAVNRSMILALRAHTIDSINALEKQLQDAKAIVDQQSGQINDLESNLSSTQSTLNATNKEKDSMALFGMQMSKGLYNMVMWFMIGGLLVLLIVFIVKFKKSNAITRAAKKTLQELDEEFEEHRRVALEREQKVRRQLQDEINKQKGV
jgi:septal ring factor EnvC (AmiA/AmiB activator)